MNDLDLENGNFRQWSMLLVYNMYRLAVILLLCILYWYNAASRVDALSYNVFLIAYLIFGLVFLLFWYKETFKFEYQVLWSGTIDIILLVHFIDTIGYLYSGLGILLNVSIAVLSILAPGRLAIYFASVASCLILFTAVIRYEYGFQNDLSVFFSMGIYGAGFFATALTAWYLANWVHYNENLANKRGAELIGILRIGEYFVERLQYGVIYIDAYSRIRLINSAARQLLNYTRKDNPLLLEELSLALNTKYIEFLSKSVQKKEVAQTIIEESEISVRFFSAAISSKPSVLILIDDMSDIEQHAQQLKVASLGRFSASIAHEMRNPLGVIAHAVQLMGGDGTLSDEDIRLKQLIKSNCDRMNSAIKNVLQLSRRQKADPEEIRLDLILNKFKSEFILENECEILLSGINNKQKMVYFDKSQFEQILYIIFENAVHHGHKSNDVAKIQVTLKIKDERHVLYIHDSGPGVDKSVGDAIFEPFFTTTRAGSGMGLYIAKDLCEINRAKLKLDNTKTGCSFSITFARNDEIQL